MIDFVKYDLLGVDPDWLLHNSYLQFDTKVNMNTGVLGNYSHAYYRGLEFKVYNPTENNPNGRITVEGSLHKYWNNGGHNYNDFNFTAINEVIADLNKKFRIAPERCDIKQLEIGVNLNPPVKTKKVLDCCLFHARTKFKWVFTNDEGNYIQVRHGNYYIKIYDKRKHYVNKGFEIPQETLRFEIKYRKEKLKKTLKLKGTVLFSDVFEFGLSNFKDLLLQEWHKILFYDFTTLDTNSVKDKYSNAIFWEELKHENYKYHRRRLNSLIAENPENLKEKIENLISEKVDFLNIHPTQINTLNIGLNRVVYDLQENALQSRQCAVTGLNIEMQKENSFLLSHEGLKYYYRTDRKVYNEVKRKYLSKEWHSSDYKKQIKEIAHNIRNTISNRRIKQKRLYPDGQITLFDMKDCV